MLKRGPKEVEPEAAGARDEAEWVALVAGLVVNVSVPVVAKRFHMSAVFHVTRWVAPRVVPP